MERSGKIRAATAYTLYICFIPIRSNKIHPAKEPIERKIKDRPPVDRKEGTRTGQGGHGSGRNRFIFTGRKRATWKNN